jgi:hypothetical protein
VVQAVLVVELLLLTLQEEQMLIQAVVVEVEEIQQLHQPLIWVVLPAEKE